MSRRVGQNGEVFVQQLCKRKEGLCIHRKDLSEVCGRYGRCSRANCEAREFRIFR